MIPVLERMGSPAGVEGGNAGGHPVVRSVSGRAEDVQVRQFLHVHAVGAGQRVGGGDSEQPVLRTETEPYGQGGLPDGKFNHGDFESPIEHGREGRAHGDLAQRRRDLVAGAQAAGCLGDFLVDAAVETDAQLAQRATAGALMGLGEHGEQRLVGRAYLIDELRAETSQFHASAGALDEWHTDTSFEADDELADTALGAAQTFGRPAEVQLLGQREQALDLSDVDLIHRVLARGPPCWA